MNSGSSNSRPASVDSHRVTPTLIFDLRFGQVWAFLVNGKIRLEIM